MGSLELMKDMLNAPVADFFGDVTLKMLLWDWFPLTLCIIAPLLCIPFVLLGICGSSTSDVKFGARTALRKISLAARADVRMGIASKHTALLRAAGFKHGGPSFMQPTANAVEAGLAYQNVRKGVQGGKSPDQAMSKAEELAIKGKAASGGKTGAKRFY